MMMFGRKSDNKDTDQAPRGNIRIHVIDPNQQNGIATDTEETKCPQCDFETIYPQYLKYHIMKHNVGQKIMEQQSRTHERYVKKGFMSERQAIACKLADRYLHITIDMQDNEQIGDLIQEQWKNLDSQQQIEFIRYLAGRLIVVGHQLDQMSMQVRGRP